MADGLIVAAPASGAGKTFVTLALLAALKARGAAIASAKAGPDYIDPRFHQAATGAPCVNLDPWAMRPALLRSLAAEAAAGAELLVIEGVMGLFDGAEGGGGSTADLAALLGLPVVLIVDAARQAQSVAALVAGFAGHRADCRIAGVVLNRVSGPRHRTMLTDALAQLAIPVLGALPNDAALGLPSRHLGLVQAGEADNLAGFIARAARLAAENIDLAAFAGLAAPLAEGAGATALPPPGARVALAEDVAFSFFYPHLGAAWRRAGAEIVRFSPLADEAPDAAADAVILPGGYPELHAGRLASNGMFLDGLAAAARRGALVYGECGGFMVLGEGLVDADGARHRMAGLLPVTTSFASRKLHLGYRRLAHDGALPWPRALRGHEFHYSVVAQEGAGAPLFTAQDSTGRQIAPMGMRRGRVMGAYAHVIDAEEAGP